MRSKSRLVIISQKLGNVRQNGRAAVSNRRLNGGVHEVHMMWFIFQGSIIFRGRQWRQKMRKRVLIILGVLLIAASTIQMATAAARNARKAARVPAPVTQQPRDRHALSAPAAIQARSCDRFWCYEDGAPVSASRK
jgi:hypothetical protein